MEIQMIHCRITVVRTFIEGQVIFYADVEHDTYQALAKGEELELSFRNPHNDIGADRFKADFMPEIGMELSIISIDSAERVTCRITAETNQTITLKRQT